MKKYSRLKAVVSLDAIAYNFGQMKKNIQKDTKIMAVVKADGYGHGAAPIARMVHDWEEIWGFAVATAEEALQLKSAGVTKPILILGLVFEEYFPELAEGDIRITVSSLEAARRYGEAGMRLGKDVHIHLAVDTGMSRIGFSDSLESIREIQEIYRIPNLKIEGIFTHFARADEYDPAPAYEQLNRYLAFVRLLEENGVSVPIHHCSNSAGIIRMPEANLNVVRAGITIYGIYPSDEVEREKVKLRPAMELKSHISHIKTVPAGTKISYGGTFEATRETRVATIPAGYADGYPRSLSGRGWVLINGRKAPVLGRVCMDQFMVDVTDIPGVNTEDEVTLMGRDGDAFLSVEELGKISGRFPYEFVCGIGRRVPRVYIKEGGAQEV